MTGDALLFTVRFLHPAAHGRADRSEPEWPPSPLRLYQALVAAAAARWNEREELGHAVSAFRWLETLTPPEIIAPVALASPRAVIQYVPDNSADNQIPAWKKGNHDEGPKRTEKPVRPVHLRGDVLPDPPEAAGLPVHYLYRVNKWDKDIVGILVNAARSISHLGWGMDMVVGDARPAFASEMGVLAGQRYQPSPSGATRLRVPVPGTMDALAIRHKSFLGRLGGGIFQPVVALNQFRVTRYRRDDEPVARPCELFELRKSDGGVFSYSHRKFIHVAGMVRHLALECMRRDPPPGVPENWLESFVAGHRNPESNEPHRQLSFVPLPSIGHVHTNTAIRRVLISAPEGCEGWLRHMGLRLVGERLRPTAETAIPEPPFLDRPKTRSVSEWYIKPATVWASVTPVILPGHDDHKPAKTRELIERALVQSGVKVPCQFEWQSQPWFPKTLSAHKYDRDKRPTGYIRPSHLLEKTAVHVKLTFSEGIEHPGPIVIGAGRHLGFGLMARWPIA